MNKMKSIILGIALIFSAGVKAQVSVNVNIGSAPQWGPVGYTDVRYYYLPDVEAYYDIETSMFIYYGGGAWIHRSRLPERYIHYDLYGGYKVVITDFRGNNPYVHFHDHRTKYKKGYKGKPQKTIGLKPGKGNPGGSSGKNSGGNSNSQKTKSHSNPKQKDSQQNKGGSGNTEKSSGNKNQKGGGKKGK